MLVSKTYQISSCDDVELNIKRESKLEFKLDYDDGQIIEALLFFIAGGAASIDDYEYVAHYAARNYKVASVRVRYHCIDNRPQLGSSFCMDERDKFIMKQSLASIGLSIDTRDINSFENMNRTLVYIDNTLKELKEKEILSHDYRLPLHVSFEPARNEYQNFGIMQAQDIINTLIYIQNHCPFKTTGGGVKTIMLGDSYGGYLANVVAKIAPWRIDSVIDIAGFVNFFGDIWRLIGFGKEVDFERFHGAFDTLLFKNILLYLSDKTHWTNDFKSKNYFSLARKMIREPLNQEHIQIQSACAKTLYLSYHSIEDERSPYKDKALFYQILQQNGFDAKLHSISSNDIDKKMIKNTRHGMGISLKLLLKKELPTLLELLQNKTLAQNRTVSYPCDDLIYSFEENNGKIHLKIQGKQ